MWNKRCSLIAPSPSTAIRLSVSDCSTTRQDYDYCQIANIVSDLAETYTSWINTNVKFEKLANRCWNTIQLIDQWIHSCFTLRVQQQLFDYHSMHHKHSHGRMFLNRFRLFTSGMFPTVHLVLSSHGSFWQHHCNNRSRQLQNGRSLSF